MHHVVQKWGEMVLLGGVPSPEDDLTSSRILGPDDLGWPQMVSDGLDGLEVLISQYQLVNTIYLFKGGFKGYRINGITRCITWCIH